MIPIDLAARLRLINEASFFDTDQPVGGLQRAREIQSQLPDLQPGQRFFATLQRALPDGSFRAAVDGKPLTLTLNTPANVGDTLELEVTQLTSRAVFARVLGGESGANASAQSSLSQTGRLISFLLTGQPTPQPASLAGQQPLLNVPPTQGAALVPLLRQAVGQSGLFYESHQAQWVLGKLDSAALAREPQGQPQAPTPGNPTSTGASATGTPATAAQAAGTTTTAAAATATAPGAQTGAASAQATGAGERAAAATLAAADDVAAPRAAPIPERLMPIVHQQLDALATNQYVWQGQAWPGQPIEWIIEDPHEGGDEGDGDGDEADTTWNTTLRLTMPRLGGVEAQLHLTAAGVALRLRADDDATIAALEARASELANALDAVDLSLTGLVVERRDG